MNSSLRCVKCIVDLKNNFLLTTITILLRILLIYFGIYFSYGKYVKDDNKFRIFFTKY